MAAKKFLKGSEEWMMFMDFWKLCQDYWEPEGNQEYWKNASESVMSFGRKYESMIFARIIALAFMDYLEAKAKQMNIPFD